MKRIFFYLIMLLLAFTLVGCGVDPDSRAPEGDHYLGDDENTNAPQAGQMSASEWSDLKNYEFFRGLFVSNQNNKGIFEDYLQLGYFNTLNMVDVTITNDEEALSNVSIKLMNNQQVIYKAITNMNGIAYLFPKIDEIDYITHLLIEHNNISLTVNYEYDINNSSLAYEIQSTNDKVDIIEIMFVIDTTGSMGDELRFLKAEIDYVITAVNEDNENSIIKLALLFYRDIGDNYVTRYFDFTTNIESQKNNLSQQSAAGGGDFEEAVDIALDEAVKKNWSQENTTKLIFHVLDAPPHNTQINMTRYYNAIVTASEKGIRMIPVASSGIDKYTEYLLRNQAMMTGGTYVYITNHSGIGNDHIDASVGEVDVEYLNHLMIRLINEYHTGIPGEKTIYP